MFLLEPAISLCSSHLQVLSAATVVAKHTSTLCNTCRLASSRTNNPVAKRHFVQSAKDVANNTANLVRAIKVSSSGKCQKQHTPLKIRKLLFGDNFFFIQTR